MRNGWLTTLVCGVAVVGVLSGSAMGQYSGGSGDPNDPWQIADPNDLIAMGQNTQHYGDYFILTADIDMAGMGPEPDGSFTTAVIAADGQPAFTGTFDGGGHVIRDLTIDDAGVGNDYLGLFGSIDAGEVRHLGIVGGSVSGSAYVGGLVGGNDGGTLTNCYATGAVNGHYWGIGGLVGYSEYGTLTSCYATGTVSGDGDDGYVGGLVGGSYYGVFTSCYATGTVSGDDYYVGGLVGQSDSGALTDCYATGAVNGSRYVGGLVGLSYYSTVNSCHATGSVSGLAYVGGLLGCHHDATVSSSYATGAVSSDGYDGYVGGLVGFINGTGGTFTSCYATGAVTGDRDYVGGLAGSVFRVTVTSCYATGVVSGGGDDVGGLVGKNDEGTLDSCYATGVVSGDGDEVGGLVGYSEYGAETNCYATGAVTGSIRVGGLVGDNWYGTVTSCYATGTVDGGSSVGGLMGYNYEGTVTDGYFLDTAGPDNGYGTPLSDSAMRQQASFVGFDFWGPGDGDQEIWGIFEGLTCPFLSWQDTTPVLVGSEPVADGTLAKVRNNVILLTFSWPITLATGAPLTIVPLPAGAEVGGQFACSVEPDGVTLRAVEAGAVLANQTWYRVSSAVGFAVEPFAFDVCTLIGDANGDGRVMALDLGLIWSHNGEVTDARYDINGDGQVVALDLGAAWAHNGEVPPAK